MQLRIHCLAEHSEKGFGQKLPFASGSARAMVVQRLRVGQMLMAVQRLMAVQN